MRRSSALALLALLLAGCLGGAAPAAPTPQDAPAAWPALDEALVRPGGKLRADELREEPERLGLRGCTLNFVFTSPDNASLYVGTASHCLTPDDPARPHRVGDAWLLGGGVRALVAYCSWGAHVASDECLDVEQGDPAHANDFALLRIHEDDRDKVHPALRHWGGPTGLAADPPAPGARVLTYGNSYLRDAGGALALDAADPQEGVVVEADARRALLRFDGPRVHGDSGSAIVTADGLALGVLQSLELEPRPGESGAVPLAFALDAMRALGGPDVQLATWPLLR